MKRTFMRTQQWLCLLGISLLLAACVEDGYDLDGDIDMTMGLGSEGLALKIGHTENIYLRDILEADRNEDGLIDTTASGLYYLIKSGEADFTVTVNAFTPRPIDPITIVPGTPLYSTTSDTQIPEDFHASSLLTAENDLDINVDDINDDIEALYSIVPQNRDISLELTLESPAGTHFTISEIKGLSISFPDFVHSSQFEEGTHTLRINDMSNIGSSLQLTRFTIDSLTTEGADIQNQMLELNGQISMSGEFTVASSGTSFLPAGSNLNVSLTVRFPELGIAEATGRFNPDIEPQVDPLEIGDDLPDFLQDPAVTLHMTNPTLRLQLEGQELPLPILFSGELSSIKDQQSLATVRIPSADFVSVAPHKLSHFYFYDGDKPFTESGKPVESNAIQEKVAGLGQIVTKLPDQINIDLGNRKIKADPSARHTLHPGTDYHISLNYDVLMPFRYDASTRIVYTDSCTDMNKDLKDYEADGITLTANAVNTVPLALNVTLIPYDCEGNDLSDVLIVEPAIAEAAPLGETKETPLTITLTARERSAVSRLDKLKFRISAESTEAAELNSNQYIRLENIRIKLNGQIIGNFN